MDLNGAYWSCKGLQEVLREQTPLNVRVTCPTEDLIADDAMMTIQNYADILAPYAWEKAPLSTMAQLAFRLERWARHKADGLEENPLDKMVSKLRTLKEIVRAHRAHIGILKAAHAAADARHSAEVKDSSSMRESTTPLSLDALTTFKNRLLALPFPDDCFLNDPSRLRQRALRASQRAVAVDAVFQRVIASITSTPSVLRNAAVEVAMLIAALDGGLDYMLELVALAVKHNIQLRPERSTDGPGSSSLKIKSSPASPLDHRRRPALLPRLSVSKSPQMFTSPTTLVREGGDTSESNPNTFGIGTVSPPRMRLIGAAVNVDHDVADVHPSVEAATTDDADFVAVVPSGGQKACAALLLSPPSTAAVRDETATPSVTKSSFQWHSVALQPLAEELSRVHQMTHNEVWSSGQNTYGELGTHDRVQRNTFVEVEPARGLSVHKVRCGNEHTLLLSAFGSAFAVGYNDSYQCGGLPSRPRIDAITPFNVPNCGKVRDVWVFNGSEHSFVSAESADDESDVQLFAMGFNSRGQCGVVVSDASSNRGGDSNNGGSDVNSSKAPVSVPTLVRMPFRGVAVRMVACSYYHSLFVLENDAVMGCGRSDTGQLGLECRDDVLEPRIILPLHEEQYQQCVRSRSIICLRDKADKGSRSASASTGMEVYDFIDLEELPPETLPNTTEDAIAFKTAAHDILTELADRITARIASFGLDLRTAVVDEVIPSRGVPAATTSNISGAAVENQAVSGRAENQAVSGRVRVVSVSAGQYHSVVVLSDGRVFAAGRNDYGQIGQTTVACSRAFSRILRGALIETRAGWSGRLAKHADDNRTSLFSELPSDTVPVPIVSCAAGYYHTLLKTWDGRVIAFGRNDAGMSGAGLAVPKVFVPRVLRFQPERGDSSDEAEIIAAGCYHSIVVVGRGASQRVYGFGRNQFGQIGTGDTRERYTPCELIVSKLGKAAPTNSLDATPRVWNIVHVAAGFYHTHMVLSAVPLAVTQSKLPKSRLHTPKRTPIIPEGSLLQTMSSTVRQVLHNHEAQQLAGISTSEPCWFRFPGGFTTAQQMESITAPNVSSVSAPAQPKLHTKTLLAGSFSPSRSPAQATEDASRTPPRNKFKPAQDALPALVHLSNASSPKPVLSSAVAIASGVVVGPEGASGIKLLSSVSPSPKLLQPSNTAEEALLRACLHDITTPLAANASCDAPKMWSKSIHAAIKVLYALQDKQNVEHYHTYMRLLNELMRSSIAEMQPIYAHFTHDYQNPDNVCTLLRNVGSGKSIQAYVTADFLLSFRVSATTTPPSSHLNVSMELLGLLCACSGWCSAIVREICAFSRCLFPSFFASLCQPAFLLHLCTPSSTSQHRNVSFSEMLRFLQALEGCVAASDASLGMKQSLLCACEVVARDLISRCFDDKSSAFQSVDEYLTSLCSSSSSSSSTEHKGCDAPFSFVLGVCEAVIIATADNSTHMTTTVLRRMLCHSRELSVYYSSSRQGVTPVHRLSAAIIAAGWRCMHSTNSLQIPQEMLSNRVCLRVSSEPASHPNAADVSALWAARQLHIAANTSVRHVVQQGKLTWENTPNCCVSQGLTSVSCDAELLDAVEREFLAVCKHHTQQLLVKGAYQHVITASLKLRQSLLDARRKLLSDDSSLNGFWEACCRVIAVFAEARRGKPAYSMDETIGGKKASKWKKAILVVCACVKLRGLREHRAEMRQPCARVAEIVADIAKLSHMSISADNTSSLVSNIREARDAAMKYVCDAEDMLGFVELALDALFAGNRSSAQWCQQLLYFTVKTLIDRLRAAPAMESSSNSNHATSMFSLLALSHAVGVNGAWKRVQRIINQLTNIINLNTDDVLLVHMAAPLLIVHPYEPWKLLQRLRGQASAQTALLHVFSLQCLTHRKHLQQIAWPTCPIAIPTEQFQGVLTSQSPERCSEASRAHFEWPCRLSCVVWIKPAPSRAIHGHTWRHIATFAWKSAHASIDISLLYSPATGHLFTLVSMFGLTADNTVLMQRTITHGCINGEEMMQIGVMLEPLPRASGLVLKQTVFLNEQVVRVAQTEFPSELPFPALLMPLTSTYNITGSIHHVIGSQVGGYSSDGLEWAMFDHDMLVVPNLEKPIPSMDGFLSIKAFDGQELTTQSMQASFLQGLSKFPSKFAGFREFMAAAVVWRGILITPNIRKTTVLGLSEFIAMCIKSSAKEVRLVGLRLWSAAIEKQHLPASENPLPSILDIIARLPTLATQEKDAWCDIARSLLRCDVPSRRMYCEELSHTVESLKKFSLQPETQTYSASLERRLWSRVPFDAALDVPVLLQRLSDLLSVVEARCGVLRSGKSCNFELLNGTFPRLGVSETTTEGSLRVISATPFHVAMGNAASDNNSVNKSCRMFVVENADGHPLLALDVNDAFNTATDDETTAQQLMQQWGKATTAAEVVQSSNEALNISGWNATTCNTLASRLLTVASMDAVFGVGEPSLLPELLTPSSLTDAAMADVIADMFEWLFTTPHASTNEAPPPNHANALSAMMLQLQCRHSLMRSLASLQPKDVIRLPKRLFSNLLEWALYSFDIPFRPSIIDVDAKLLLLQQSIVSLSHVAQQACESGWFPSLQNDEEDVMLSPDVTSNEQAYDPLRYADGAGGVVSSAAEHASSSAAVHADGGVRVLHGDDDDAATPGLEELLAMGFDKEWCTLALQLHGDDIDGAVAWIVDNSELLRVLLPQTGEELPDNDDNGDDEGVLARIKSQAVSSYRQRQYLSLSACADVCTAYPDVYKDVNTQQLQTIAPLLTAFEKSAAFIPADVLGGLDVCEEDYFPNDAILFVFGETPGTVRGHLYRHGLFALDAIPSSSSLPVNTEDVAAFRGNLLPGQLLLHASNEENIEGGVDCGLRVRYPMSAKSHMMDSLRSTLTTQLYKSVQDLRTAMSASARCDALDESLARCKCVTYACQGPGPIMLPSLAGTHTSNAFSHDQVCLHNFSRGLVLSAGDAWACCKSCTPRRLNTGMHAMQQLMLPHEQLLASEDAQSSFGMVNVLTALMELSIVMHAKVVVSLWAVTPTHMSLHSDLTQVRSIVKAMVNVFADVHDFMLCDLPAYAQWHPSVASWSAIKQQMFSPIFGCGVGKNPWRVALETVLHHGLKTADASPVYVAAIVETIADLMVSICKREENSTSDLTFTQMDLCPWGRRSTWELSNVTALPGVEAAAWLFDAIVDRLCEHPQFACNFTRTLMLCFLSSPNIAFRTVVAGMLSRMSPFVAQQADCAPISLLLSQHAMGYLDTLMRFERDAGRMYFSKHVAAIMDMLCILPPSRVSPAFADKMDVLFVGNNTARLRFSFHTAQPRILQVQIRVAAAALHAEADVSAANNRLLTWNSRCNSLWSLHDGPEVWHNVIVAFNDSAVHEVCLTDLFPNCGYHVRARVVDTPHRAELVPWQFFAGIQTPASPAFFWDARSAGPGIIVFPTEMSRKLNASIRRGVHDNDLLPFSATYLGSESWCLVLGSCGFTMGVNRWSIRIDRSISNYLFVGVATGAANACGFLGSDEHGWGFLADCALYHKHTKLGSYGTPFATGDTVTVELDCDAGTLSFAVNGVSQGIAFENLSGKLYPAVGFYHQGQKVTLLPAEVNCYGAGVNIADAPSRLFPEDVATFSCVTDVMETGVQTVDIADMYAIAEGHVLWEQNRLLRTMVRGGFEINVDVSDAAVVETANISSRKISKHGKQVDVIGAHGGKLWYKDAVDEAAWMVSYRDIESAGCESASIQTDEQLFARAEAARTATIQFMDYVCNPKRLGLCGWSSDCDMALISLVNELSDQNDTSPWSISHATFKTAVVPKLIAKCFISVPSPDAVDLFTSVAAARFSVWRWWNDKLRCLIPLLDYTSLTSDIGPTEVPAQHTSWAMGLQGSAFTPKLQLQVSRWRQCIFRHTIRAVLASVLDRTATLPKRLPDDYDFPDDLPTVTINRLKAVHQLNSVGSSNHNHNSNTNTAEVDVPHSTSTLLQCSVFGQLFHALHPLSGQTLRLAYSHPMDDGQLRCFRVQLEGEGSDDYSGPYREVFSVIARELQMLSPSSPSQTLLRLLLPAPNAVHGLGEGRETFVLNPVPDNSTLAPSVAADGSIFVSLGEGDANFLNFMGQFLGMAWRSRIHLEMCLFPHLWKALTYDTVGDDDIDAIDSSFGKLLQDLSAAAQECVPEAFRSDDVITVIQTLRTSHPDLLANAVPGFEDLQWTVTLSNERVVSLEPGVAPHDCRVVSLEDVLSLRYIAALRRAKLHEFDAVLEAVRRGFVSVVPGAVMPLLRSKDLEFGVCGAASIDIGRLMENTDYEESISPLDPHIQHFWRALRSFSAEERGKFLQFVWGRTRLPHSGVKLSQRFKIQDYRMTGTAGEQEDDLIPTEGASAPLNPPARSASALRPAARFLLSLQQRFQHRSSAMPLGTRPASASEALTTPLQPSRVAAPPPTASRNPRNRISRPFTACVSRTQTPLDTSMDHVLPTAHVCFFALRLPRYSSEAVARRQLLYAINNCGVMDADFRLTAEEAGDLSYLDAAS